MAKGHLSNDDFFQRLAELFDERRQKDHGSITLSQKRMTYGQDESMPAPSSDTTSTATSFPDTALSSPLPIIIRATNGKNQKTKPDKKIKLSTIVEVDALEAFYLRYADVCKAGMSNLKKRDRSKAKEKLKAKKKKQSGAAVEIKK